MAHERSAADAGQELSYRLRLRDPSRTGELLSELRATDGVADASVHLRQDESEL